MALSITPLPAAHIVALEGPSAIVSAQLRLLPASPRILFLPSLEHYMSDSDPDAPFDAGELILRYHAATHARHAAAMEFLRLSTAADERRLVFMHGGTLSAHAACLSAIMEHEVEGSIEDAHATFLRLASNGVAGLSSTRCSLSRAGASTSARLGADEDPTLAPVSEGRGGQQMHWGACMSAVLDGIEDPIIRAMRAADALYRETEFLQPLTPDVDLTVKLVDVPPPPFKRRAIQPVAKPAESARARKTPSPSPSRLQSSELLESASRVFGDESHKEGVASATPRKPHLRIRIQPSPIPRAGDFAPDPARRLSTTTARESPQTIRPIRSLTRIPASGDSVKDGVLGMPNLETDGVSASVEHYEGAALAGSSASTAAGNEEKPFIPVLPLFEDLVVLFSPETPNELHNFVFRRLSESNSSQRRQSAPRSPSSTEPKPVAYTNEGRVPLTKAGQGDGDEHSAHARVTGDCLSWMRKDLVHGFPTPNQSSPTPSDTASTRASLGNTRFYSISVGERTAMSVQNDLRSCLASQFPPQDRRFSAAMSPESAAEAGLWRLLGCDSPRLAAPVGERRLDLILAVGAETGVKKSRLSEVVELLEKLEYNASGISRSGRLDIRYLIANAMQAFTAQPLAKQMLSNPFADRTLLAALILPHLETYLGDHPDVRLLLIEYPSEHLPTVLALQTLVGTEMMKVVGIINSDTSPASQSPPTPDRRPSEGFRALCRRGPRMPGAFVGSCSFSKANYLLASSATGLETAAFLAAIRESLISISDFYIPDRPLYKPPAPISPPGHPCPPTFPVSAKSASALPTASRPEGESFRTSASTLVITPPSSPATAPSSAPNHPSSSFSSLALTASGPARTDPGTSAYSSALSGGRSGIRWGEINYSPSSSPPVSTGDTTIKSAVDTSASKYQVYGHEKKDSDPLSPRAMPYKATAGGDGDAYRGRGGDGDGNGHVGLDDAEGYEHDDLEDDDMEDEEVRRLMPLFLRTREEIERGRRGKGLEWLGLS